MSRDPDRPIQSCHGWHTAPSRARLGSARLGEVRGLLLAKPVDDARLDRRLAGLEPRLTPGARARVAEARREAMLRLKREILEDRTPDAWRFEAGMPARSAATALAGAVERAAA